MLSALLFWSDLNNLNSFRGNLGGDWLGYFGSLVGSLITALVFYLTLSFEHQKLREERLEKDKQEIIEARPIFYISKSDSNSTELEVYSKNGIPLKKVDAIVKYKNSERESLSLSLKIDTKILTGDVEYLKIESLNIKNEKNYFVYNSQENRELNFSENEQQHFFYGWDTDCTILELQILLKGLGKKINYTGAYRKLNKNIEAYLYRVAGISFENEKARQQLYYELSTMENRIYEQSPLSKADLLQISQVSLHVKLGQGKEQLENLYYQSKKFQKDKKYLELLKLIIDSGIVKFSEGDKPFIGEFEYYLKKFYHNIGEPVISVIELFNIEKLSGFVDLLYNNYEFASDDVRKLPSYILSSYLVNDDTNKYLSMYLLNFISTDLLFEEQQY